MFRSLTVMHRIRITRPCPSDLSSGAGGLPHRHGDRILGPFALTDVTRSPYCMVNLGGLIFRSEKSVLVMQDRKTDLWRWFLSCALVQIPADILAEYHMSLACLQRGDLDIGYLSELDRPGMMMRCR